MIGVLEFFTTEGKAYSNDLKLLFIAASSGALKDNIQLYTILIVAITATIRFLREVIKKRKTE